MMTFINLMQVTSKRATRILLCGSMIMLASSHLCYAHGPIQTEVPVIDVTTYPPIEEDIAAMANYGAKARAAGQRLVERGVDTLSYAHAVVADPSSPFPQRMQLITVLGEIGDPDSADVIIDAAEENIHNRYLYQNALLALAKIEPDDDIIKFVNDQLVDEKRDPLMQRSALAYYAQQPTPEATQWVNKYAAANASPDVRYAALYLGGKLGMQSVKADIIELLKSGQNISREYYLLLGLTEITTLEEFNQIIKDLKLHSNNRTKALQYAELIKGTKEQRDQRAKELLAKGDNTQKRVAVEKLINEQNAEALADNWKQGDGFVRAAVRRAGLEVHDDEHGAHFEPYSQQRKAPTWLFILVATGFLGMAWLWQRKQREK